MKKIIAKINFVLNDIPYIEGEELYGLTYEQIVNLNEKGFIQPLDYKELVILERELKNEKQKKEDKL